mmetsp:Transcript_9639/g.23018  ORF Transcript_9639/g.23018 Transcript_9639/m.23018 type:complete len:91 (-) Transcript_9639:119-391(-)
MLARARCTARPAMMAQKRGFPVMRGDEFARHMGLGDVDTTNCVAPGAHHAMKSKFGYSKKYASNWERIFGKDKKKDAADKQEKQEAEKEQ